MTITAKPDGLRELSPWLSLLAASITEPVHLLYYKTPTIELVPLEKLVIIGQVYSHICSQLFFCGLI